MTVGTDDTQPLLRSVTNEGQQVYTNPVAPPLQQDAADIAQTTIVDFDPDGDAENPLDWPASYRWVIVSILAFMAFTVYVLPPPFYLSPFFHPVSTPPPLPTLLFTTPYSPPSPAP